MPSVRVHALTISLDGYGDGPEQGLDNPLASVRLPLSIETAV